MSLLEDLQGLDLSSVLDARDVINTSLNSEELQKLINGDGLTTALGTLGESINALQTAQSSPQALLGPVVEAVGELDGAFDTGDLDLAEYTEVVRDGAQVLSQIFALIGNGDPAEFTMPNGERLGSILNHAANFNQHFSTVGFDDAATVKHLLDTVEQGVPADPDGFAEFAIDVLLPFNSNHLKTVRESVNSLTEGANHITVDVNINAGALASLERLRLSAEAGDAAAVNSELAQLNQIRTNTLNAIRNLIRQGTVQIRDLNIEQHIQTIEGLTEHFETSPTGALEFLDRLREEFTAMRQLVETAELPELGPIIDDIAEQAETLLRQNVEQPIDRAVNDIKTWLRNQLARLNLRHYRGLLSRFFKDIEQQIQAANLDGPANEARAFLDTIENTINNFDLSGDVQGVLGNISGTINDTVANLEASLQQIVDGVNDVAAAAESILQQMADLLEQFQNTVEGITAAVENLGIEQARDQVIDAIQDLKQAAESLLSETALPDSLKPLVDDVIKELDKIDVDEVLDPVFDALDQLHIPPSTLDPINDVLEEASTVIQNLITDELIAQLESEFQSAIDELNRFDPANLLDGVNDYFEEAAGFIEQLDPRPIVEEIRGPYDAVVQAVDAVHPNRLLRPVIEAYEGVFSAIDMSNPSDSLAQLNQTLNQTGEQIGQQVAQPVAQLTGSQTSTADGAGADTASASPPSTTPEVRPGDIIRLLGYIPNQLRQALLAMEAGPAGDALAAIDQLCGGLAQQIRQLQQHLWQAERTIFNSVEAVLKPLSSAQMQAQLAISANFSVTAEEGGVQVDVNGAAQLLGSMSSGAMRSDLDQELASARQHIAQIIGGAGGSGGALLDRIVFLLENCSLANIGKDLDALLDALDPEPLAAELDAVAGAALARLPEITQMLDDGAQQAIERLLLLIQQFNPVSQGMKFLTVFDVIREQLELLNPRRLAAELAEIHGAIRHIILAYDPGVFAEEVHDLVEAVAAQIRGLDPAALLGDLSPFDDLSESLQGLSPATALTGIDGQLDEVGERLKQIDLARLLEAVNDLPGRVEESVTTAGQAIIDNLKELLSAIEYTSSNASASASGEFAVG